MNHKSLSHKSSNRKIKRSKIEGKDEMDREIRFTSFTPGWKEYTDTDERPALPIKSLDGKVIPVNRIKTSNQAKEMNENDDNEIESMVTNTNNSSQNTSTTSFVRQVSISERIIKMIAESSMEEIKSIIGTICVNITTDPQSRLVLKRNKISNRDVNSTDSIKVSEVYDYDMKDLLEFFRQEESVQISELAMLSACLVFKDIIPSYKIRQTTNSTSKDGEIKLKKETKRLMDFETSLLQLYKTYIDILKSKVTKGLGIVSTKKSLEHGSSSSRNNNSNSSFQLSALGISALRCQCELLRKVSHFNYRDDLIESMLSRAAFIGSNSQIQNLCCQTIIYLFNRDNEGDLSLEIIKHISTILSNTKYHVPELFIETLQHVHLTVHADKADSIRKQVKKEKRKRKRHQDEADIAMLESNAMKEKNVTEKFQVNCLKEIAMIYFRIIKVKVGFHLFAVVLQGLGKITHLINIDMIEDLIPVLKDILLRHPPVPNHIKALCIHCVLKTILGPGQELQVDDDVFLLQLHQLLVDLPADYKYWNIIYEAIDFAYLKRRESRSSMISTVVKALFLSSCHLSSTLGVTGFALAHAILLRYPKIRMNIQILSNKSSFESDPEEVVEDYAMSALREASSNRDMMDHSIHNTERSGGDGSLVIAIMRHHFDKRFTRIIDAMLLPDIHPIPFSISDAIVRPGNDELDRMDHAITSLSKPKSNQQQLMNRKNYTTKSKFNGNGNISVSDDGNRNNIKINEISSSVWKSFCKYRNNRHGLP